MQTVFFDPTRTYDDNFDNGPYPQLAPEIPQRKITKKYKFLDFEINLPFGIPAGPLPTSKHIKAAFDYGFDVSHYKTQRSTVFPVNQFPNVLYVDVEGDLTIEGAKKPLVGRSEMTKDPKEITITNSFGNPCRGPEFWQEDMKKAISYTGDGQLMIASVVGTIKKGFSDEDYYDDFAYTAKLANETGAKVIEVNLSCPNVANEGIICFAPDAVVAICRKSKEAIGNTPLLAKVGYFSKDQEELLEAIIKKTVPFVSGWAAINTIPAPVVDTQGNQALPGPNRLQSGICGAGIKWAGVDMVKRLKTIREKLNLDFAILGVGGVMTPKDFIEYRRAGADVVQSSTGAMWNPYLAQEIWREENQK